MILVTLRRKTVGLSIGTITQHKHCTAQCKTDKHVIIGLDFICIIGGFLEQQDNIFVSNFHMLQKTQFFFTYRDTGRAYKLLIFFLKHSLCQSIKSFHHVLYSDMETAIYVQSCHKLQSAEAVRSNEEENVCSNSPDLHKIQSKQTHSLV